ncbi:transmembrane protein 69 [Hyla sarda]|uniref:transmembrane protein 69 n=1 Tax=Hyla sarda TaxID=327740 RepID=UPI0024C3B0ED|nr:transmembrane protein 69 [Hyla sarda]XP_056387671.1 transmembrane protein 69 [Hyla sarda]XP_056387672.1 transmembrane protein 69 [Hyla sarda]
MLLLRLGGKCWPSALQLCKMAAPVCRQKSHAVITWKSYMTQFPAMAALTTLRCPPPPLSRGFHSSSSLHKRRRNEQDDEFNQMLENHRQELKKTPRSAVYLSLAGLAPMVVAPLTMSIGGYYYPEMAYLQIATASCLLSFYGGIRWGISVPENSPWGPDSLNFLLGALLPFVAWTALLTSDDILVSALTVISGMVLGVFGGVGMLHPFPFWLSFLRAISFLVTLCSIAITLYLSVVYPEKSLKNQSPK